MDCWHIGIAHPMVISSSHQKVKSKERDSVDWIWEWDSVQDYDTLL